MALRPVDVFPGKTAGTSTAYPHGEARDVSAPGAGDGTPWNATYINEVFGFLQGLLGAAGATPNASPETATASQYVGAIETLIANAVNAGREASWPVGSIYETTEDGDPSILLGFGTWELYGVGRVTVCLDDADAAFNAVGQTGGAKTHSLSGDEIGDHVHQWHIGVLQGSTTNIDMFGGGVRGGTFDIQGNTSTYNDDPMAGDRYTSKQIGAGTGDPHNNLQPYVVLYRWRRTV